MKDKVFIATNNNVYDMRTPMPVYGTQDNTASAFIGKTALREE